MEFRRKYSEVKNYKANMISTLFNEFIFIIGLFFMIKNVGKLNTTMIFVIGSFYIFRTVISETVYELETEIRSKTLFNLTLSRTSILVIYFKRSLVTFVRTILIFFVNFLFFYKDIRFTELDFRNFIMYLLLILTIVYSLYYTFFSLCIIFERISTFTSFFSALVLAFSSDIALFRELFNILLGKEYNLPIIVYNIIFLFLITLIFLKFAFRKINNYGI